MKLKFIKDLDYKRKKGHEVEVDKIQFDADRFAYGFGVRVVGEWRRPRWFTIAWFMELPNGGYVVNVPIVEKI
jgi:hypothetical protein